MKNLLSSAALVTGLLILSSPPAEAQPGSGGPSPANPTAPTQIPLDGGASLLLASGVAYGLRRLRNRRNAK